MRGVSDVMKALGVLLPGEYNPQEKTKKDRLPHRQWARKRKRERIARASRRRKR